jgi:tRNA(fMet)-specific endonuclease VapC
MNYLLDTNAWIAFLRQSQSPLVALVQSHQVEELQVCSIVTAELLYGCLRSAKPETNRTKVQALLQPYLSLPFDDSAADQFAAIRQHLDALGTPIGPYDMQIAAIAHVNRCTLVTHNVQEFNRVPGLLIEDWELP